MHLAGASKDKDYSADAISANTNMASTHFENFHVYRLEWQPAVAGDGDGEGHNGYIIWYLDGDMLFKLDGAALKLSGSTIPEEPMYLLLNTAVSSTWGFPTPCPKGCDYCTSTLSDNCFDCRKQECACSMPASMCDNFPAEFLIDHVRVYQTDENLHPSHSSASHKQDQEEQQQQQHDSTDNSDTSGAGDTTGNSDSGGTDTDTGSNGTTGTDTTNQKQPKKVKLKQPKYIKMKHKISAEPLGCSTPSHPTSTYIRGHWDKYMNRGDAQPLKEIVVGGGICDATTTTTTTTTSTTTSRSSKSTSRSTSRSISTSTSRSTSTGEGEKEGRGGRGEFREGGGGEVGLDPHKDSKKDDYSDDDDNTNDKVRDTDTDTATATSLICGGNSRGHCSVRTGVCICRGGYTGPQCMSVEGYDDVQYTHEEWPVRG